MGNANGGQQHSTSVPSDHGSSASRNPLQPVSGTWSSRMQKVNASDGGKQTSNDRSVDDDDDRRSFAVPQPPLPPPSSALPLPQVGNGSVDGARMRRVSVAINSAEDPPHQTPQRLNSLRRHGTGESLGSNSESFASHGSSLNGKPRLTLVEARELLLSIFFPRPGQLECIASGFLTLEQYALMRGFWVPFLTTELRDKWYLDAVMLSVLGKDRWRSSRQQKEIIMSVAPSREQVLQLNQQRQDYNDQLRERLLDLCGSLVESNQQHTRKNLQSLLEEYRRHKETQPSAGSGNGSGGNVGGEQEQVPGHTSSETTTSMQHQEVLSLALMRLQTTVSTSFDCFDLLASRIPTSIISSLPSNYFLNSIPVVYDAIAFEEKKVGDLDTMSFFMSIESRRCLLNEQVEDAERLTNITMSDFGLPQSFSGMDGSGRESLIGSARQLYTAVRHAGLVVTTACSSMVLTVMFHLADVLRARQVFRDNRIKATQKGITLEQLVGRKEATIRSYSGKPTDDLEELKRYAITDEMSLAVLTHLLVERFKKENRAKMEKLRKRYPNLFAYLEAIAPQAEQNDFDVTRLLSGMVLKLMFLTGGGQRSIVADDRRVPGGVQQITDDVALSNMLEVPILNRICWVACMMGMPIMSNHGMLAQKHQGKPMTYIELDECCGVIRKLFQAVGALPCGDACPQAFKEWFPLFPFYAVNAEGKRVLLYLYMAQVSAIQRVPLTIQKDMTLLSFATALKAAKGRGRVDIANYFFEPTLVIGYNGKDKDDEMNSMSTFVGAERSTRYSHTTTTTTTTAVPAPLSPTAVSGGGGGGGPGSFDGCPSTTDKYEYMTAVNVNSPTSLAAAKTSPTKTSAQKAGGGATAGGQSKSLLLDGKLSPSSSSSASLSCSTLMDEDRDIDVYTCVNPQTQLYMRCCNEATVRRHRTTELTPSVSVAFMHSQHELQAKRPDLAPALSRAVPKLMPSEGFLVLCWTSTEPLVTFCVGDIISAMAERTSSSSSNSNNNANAAKDNAGHGSGGLGSPNSGRYFTGATRPAVDDGGGSSSNCADTSNENKGFSLSGGTNQDDSNTRTRFSSSSPRVPTVKIDDSMLQVISPNDHTNGNNHYEMPSTGYGSPDDEMGSTSSSSYNAREKTRMYQGIMHEFLGIKEKVSQRLGVRWSVLDVLPSNQLVHYARRRNMTANSSAASGNNSNTSSAGNRQLEQYRNEVVLHVAAVEMPVSFPLKILTIGHERASMSVFTFVSPNSDSVCWANPRLIEAIMNRDENGSGQSSSSCCGGSGGFLQGSCASAAAKGPSGILCNTEEELHNVFFSIGVLLSNAIVNGVYFSAPLAPLAFYLMKKALASGDYSFKSFMWLEPADGNLLSPALVLNSAYEILTMTEQQYIAFLDSRGLTNSESRVFPVMHSLLDEMKEDRLWQTTSTQPTRDEGRPSPQHPHQHSHHHPQQLSPSSQASGLGRSTCTQATNETSSLAGGSNARERSMMMSRLSSSSNEYVKLIQLHNRRGSAFRGSQACSPGSSDGANANLPHHFLMAASVPVQDRLQGYRNQQQKSEAQSSFSASPSMEMLYAKLPSRREYIFLYLVNDLTWSSVRREGVGEKNKELWVSMARGFMTSAVAKSPLMTNCCSRIIREVLCVPRPNG